MTYESLQCNVSCVVSVIVIQLATVEVQSDTVKYTCIQYIRL